MSWNIKYLNLYTRFCCKEVWDHQQKTFNPEDILQYDGILGGK